MPVRTYRRKALRTGLQCTPLEHRIVPTHDIILDFDGGMAPASPNYGIVANSGTVNFKAFTAFDAFFPAGKGDRTEQIRQIVSGVRQDFADFDVNVIWDDRGVTSPFFNARDTVVMVTDDENSVFPNSFPNAIGIAPLDLTNSEADVALVFVGSIRAAGGFFPPTAAVYINGTIGTISHEVGHTIGQSHVTMPDSQNRQMMAEAASGLNIDNRFTPEPLDHLDPEAGIIYSERARCQQNLGLAKAGTTTQSQEILTNQALEDDTPIISLDAQGIGVFSGNITFGGGAQPLSIDFGGDGDAFQILLEAGKTYSIRQRAAGSKIDPILTLYDLDGDFIAAGSQGTAGGVSLLTFTPTATEPYFIVANTSMARATTGVAGTRTLGAYNLEITPTWFEIDSVAKVVKVPGDANANTFAALRNASGVMISVDANSITIPTKYANAFEYSGGTGNDVYNVDLSGGPIDLKIFDIFGSDQIIISGTPAADVFNIQPTLVTTDAGAKLALGGIDRITVNGLAGNDQFTITPGPIPILVNGGSPTPPAKFGDFLRLTVLDGKQTPANLTDGKFTFPAAQPVVYTGIEAFDANLPPPVRSPKNSFAVASGPGALPQVTFYSAGRDFPTFTIMAYDESFRGGVRVATGDVDGDGIADLVTAAGPGGGPHVEVFSGVTGTLLDSPIGSFFAYSGFTGGVYVASGDVNGDGKADIITGADSGGGSHVRVFDGVTREVIREFFAFIPQFRGGVRVAAGDVNGDGKADIICAAGPGGGPHVKVFSGASGQLLREFFAYEASFTGGVFVSAADVTGDGIVDIATGAGDGGGPVAALFDGTNGAQLSRFNAYPPVQQTGLYTGDGRWASGVRVALSDTDGDGIAELYVAPGRGKAGPLKGFSLNFFSEIWTQAASDPTFLGGMYVGS